MRHVMALQTLAAAKSGSLPGLTYLPSLVETDIGLRYALEVLEIFLLFLKPSLVPKIDDIRRGDTRALTHGARGILSLTGIAQVLEKVYTSDPSRFTGLKAKFAAGIARKLDHIVIWFGYYLNPWTSIETDVPSGARQTTHIDQFATFLVTATNLSTAIFDTIWENDGIQDLIVDIWFMRNGDFDPSDLACLSGFKKEDYYISTIKYGYHKVLISFSIPAIMQQTLLDAKTRPKMVEKLFHRLESDQHGRTDGHFQLAASILSRIEQVRSRVETGYYPALYAFQNLEILFEIMRRLTGWVASDDMLTGATPYDPLAPSIDCRKLYHSFYKAGYIMTVTSTLLCISNAAVASETAPYSETPTCFLAATVVPHFLFTNLYPEPASHLKCRFQSMLDNGALKVIANAAAIWHKSHLSFRQEQAKYQFDWVIVFQSLFTFCVQAACYPSLVHPLHRAFNALSREQWVLFNQSCTAAAGKVQQYYPDAGPQHDWAAEFHRQSSHWLALFIQFRNLWRSMLCDSEAHYLETDSAPEIRRQARKCMGCGSAVYCSIPCQIYDWNHRHREECRGGRVRVRDMDMDITLKCSPRTRAWHILLLQDFVCNGGWTPDFLTIFDSPPGSHVARVQFYGVPFNVESVKKLTEYQPRRLSSDEALEDSFRRDFLLWTAPPTVQRQDGSRLHFRLIEGVFALAHPNVVALVMLKLCICEPPAGSDDALTSVCMDSITRIGPYPIYNNTR
ncbi:hypothetical protein BKA70DRAFT_190411 [Coprinopsis sp. MPI-PUGE-AT-0042]|nr:hypothetical protein BKA70DRAFT_190411 [Coprinopsis sp. MPI-PUGE-AT-0042]